MNAHNERQWPEYLMLRDTGLYDDAGGLGQHIFTTAGAGYVKQKYVRADLAAQPSPVVKQNLTTQPAAAQEAVVWQWRNLRAETGWKDCTRAVYDVFRQNGLHYEVRKLYAAPVTAAPGIDLGQFRQAVEYWKLRWANNGDLLVEANRLLALIDASPKGDVHPDDLAVDAFAAAMKAKLVAARAKGRGGWNGDEPGMQQRLSDMLRAHVEKGDPRDVANFCMFLHQRGESIRPKGGSEAREHWLDRMADIEGRPRPEPEPDEVEEVIACLGDDAAAMLNENPEDERALNMQRAADLLAELQANSHGAGVK